MKCVIIKTSTLTNNERIILKKIIGGNRITDTQIAHEMGMSQQAVYQIRKKLEDAGIIKGYMPVLDFKKLGINIFYYVGIEIQPVMWAYTSSVNNFLLYDNLNFVQNALNEDKNRMKDLVETIKKK